MVDRDLHERYAPKLFPGSSHVWALRQLADLPQQSRILDIGPGSGLIGQKLKEKGLNNLYAVEIDQAARQRLLSTYLEVHDSLDPLKGRRFDLILLLDVLEHLTDPFEYFEHISELLSPGGKVMVSVPNVAHWSVRIPLLFGFFEYTERAILDRSHYRFFNRRRFKKLLRINPHLTVLKLGVTIEPAEFVLPKWVWNNSLFRLTSRIRILAAKVLPGLMAYQLMALLRKKE